MPAVEVPQAPSEGPVAMPGEPAAMWLKNMDQDRRSCEPQRRAGDDGVRGLTVRATIGYDNCLARARFGESGRRPASIPQ